jgi:hypothetical protein
MMVTVMLGYISNYTHERSVRSRVEQKLCIHDGYTVENARAKAEQIIKFDKSIPYRISDEPMKALSREIQVGWYIFGYKLN